MKKSALLLSLLIIFSTSFAQKSGQILNQKTNEPVPYVNIQVKGKRQGFTSDLNGKFKVTSIAKDSLVFSAIGYKNKTLSTGTIGEIIVLKPVSYNIPEVTINNEEEKTIIIGRVKKQIIQLAYGSTYGGEMAARYFPYIDSYQDTKFIRSIEFLTESKVDHAKFNLRLYKADSLGYPSTPIHNKNIIILVEKGDQITTEVELIKQYIQFPKEGLFVIIEWLNLEENKSEYTYNSNGEKKTIIELQPSFYAESHEKKEKGWTNWGNWELSKSTFTQPIQMKITLRN